MISSPHDTLYCLHVHVHVHSLFQCIESDLLAVDDKLRSELHPPQRLKQLLVLLLSHEETPARLLDLPKHRLEEIRLPKPLGHL